MRSYSVVQQTISVRCHLQINSITDCLNLVMSCGAGLMINDIIFVFRRSQFIERRILLNVDGLTFPELILVC